MCKKYDKISLGNVTFYPLKVDERQNFKRTRLPSVRCWWSSRIRSSGWHLHRELCRGVTWSLKWRMSWLACIKATFRWVSHHRRHYINNPLTLRSKAMHWPYLKSIRLLQSGTYLLRRSTATLKWFNFKAQSTKYHLKLNQCECYLTEGRTSGKKTQSSQWKTNVQNERTNIERAVNRTW